jgi:3-oxoacyl-[acyl-carrier protein] reductase
MSALLDSTSALSGLIAVVTGGSGGIGGAVALEFARQGASVAVHGHRNQEKAALFVRDIREFGGEAVLLSADLSHAATRASFVENAWNWKSRIDILVNLAGADVLTGDAASWSFEKKLTALWNVDCLATVGLSRAIGQRMKDRGSGVILNIGWDQAEHGMAGDSGEMFATVKGAVMAFTRSLAQSLAPEVRVNCLAPGWIRTAWGEKASNFWQERAKRQSLRARWGTPEDIARAAAFLVSPAADFCTGQVVPINGGFRFE